MERVVYLNGRFLPHDQVSISPFDEGFLYGYGLFETMRAYRGRVFALSLHMERLEKGCRVLKIPPPSSLERMEEVLSALLERNGLAGKDAYVRVTVTGGVGGQPTLLAFSRPLPDSLKRKKEGVRAVTARLERGWELASLKTTSYLLMHLKRREAEARGKDEALLVMKGVVLEGTHTNLFMVKDGRVITPPLSLPILPGITRGIVMDLLKRKGIPCCEEAFTLEDLLEADEAFLTNSLLEVAPLIEVDGREMRKGGFTEEVGREYRTLTGSSHPL